MGMQTLDTCIGAYFCDATGFDTVGKKLVDKTAYGNHLDIKLLTAPVYATRAGQQVMDFDNTYYFEGENLLKPGGSCVIVGVCDMSGADGTQYVVNTQSRKAAFGNFAGVPNDSTDAEWFTSAYGRGSLWFNTMAPRIFEPAAGTSAAGSAFVAGAMNIFTGAINIYPAQMQASTKSGAATTTNFASGATAVQAGQGSVMRIGAIKAAGAALTAGKYISAKRIYFFNGNVFNHPNFVATRADEIALWGI